MENNTPIVIDENALSATNEIRKAITEKHKKQHENHIIGT